MSREPEYDFDEIQKAMEDTERDAFDYFLDRETGEVIILSEDIMQQARRLLEETYDDDLDEYDEVEVDRVPDVPDWAEDEVELALDVFLHRRERYAHIPERAPENAYHVMQEFSDSIENEELRHLLKQSLEGQGAFRKFKDLLGPHPKERKMWYVFNAKAVRQEIGKWLAAVSASPASEAHDDTGTD